MSLEERQAFKEYVNLAEKCMNPDADPRDDFIEYSSGRFRDENFDKKNGEYPPSCYECRDICRSVLENEQISGVDVEKARDFCRSRRACLEGGLKEYLKSDQFNEFCGGLPVFNDNWSAANFSLARAAGILFALQFKTILVLRIEHMGDTKVIFMTAYEFPHHILQTMEVEILKLIELEDNKSTQIINDLNLFKEIYPEELDEEEYLRRTGVELQNYADIFDFKVFIETALSVTIDDEDIIHFQEGVMSFLRFLTTLDSRVLANYLTAMAIYENFNQVRGGNVFDVERIFRPILVSACFEKFYNEIEEKKYKYTAERFNKSYEAMEKKFPENIRLVEHEAFRTNYDLILNYIEENYNSTKIRKEYENLEISPDNFHQNLIRIKNYGIPKSVKKFDSINGIDYDMIGFVMNFLNCIIVQWNKPIVFHFSGQEANYWRFIIAERDEQFNVNYIEKDKLIEILENQMEQLEELSYNFYADSITFNIEAIMYAYRDFKIWMRENETTVEWQNEILSTISLDCEKLFFVAFAQHLTCHTFSNKCTAIMTLMNCEEFSKIFKCSPESRMNPRRFLF